jgi:hypothetical protein
MATQTITGSTRSDLQLTSFERFAGMCGVLSGLSGLGYAVAFVVLRNPLLSSIFLMLGGLLSSAVLVALERRVRAADASWSTWALALSLAGAAGALIHGGYDLANVVNPPATPIPDLPSAVDPRGLLTFGVTGLGIWAFSLLIARSKQFSGALALGGLVLAALLIVIYLGRLIVLDPASPIILIPVLLAGFVVNPAWNIGLGLSLWRGRGEQ